MSWINKYEDHLKATASLNLSTINQHLSRLRPFDEWLSKRNDLPPRTGTRIKSYGHISAATDELVATYFEEISQERSAGLRHHIKTALRGYYKYLVEIEVIDEAPSLKVAIRRSDSERGVVKNVPRSENIATIRSIIAPKPEAKRIVLETYVMTECFIQLGLRVSELQLLTPAAFDGLTNRVTVRSTKTETKSQYGGDRIMPLPPELHKKVRQYCDKFEIAETDIIFGASYHTILRRIKQIGNDGQLPWLTLHSFRHYCITKYCSLVGADGATPIFRTQELSMMFGVSPEVIAKYYDHPDPESIVAKAVNSGVFDG